ncbi:site-specific integrase [SAR202 cluster bacterium AD-804-J14_MRT_500m]|nr:site-specific integrase [SAR202 cluster bacterium AD-804-J14_MRT_500m]MQF69604.1 site-specific integrase [SAR202 cluster bacterium AD-804-J14_MRT_500m]
MKGSIRRRSRGSWELTVDMGRDSSGKRLRKFLSVKGTKAEAERRLRELLSSLDKGIPVDTGKITVGALLERWIRDYVLPNTRPRTAERYESDMRLHIVPSIGHIPLSKLSPNDVQAMESHLLAAGLSGRSVRHVHAVLREAVKHAMRWGLVHRNVVATIDPPKTRRPELVPPDADEVLQLLELAKRTNYHPVFQFMAYTGCRRGEALGLTWKNVDFTNAMASIVQSLQRLKGHGLVLQPPKSAKSRRSIALDPETVSTLRELRGVQLLQEMEFAEAYKPRGLVFPGPLGGLLDPSVLTRTFKQLCKRIGRPHIRLHDLRHFHATMMLQAGTNPKVVQERLGHSSFAITMDTYSHVVPGLQEQAVKDFASAMTRVQRSI